jgi:hypothetical protein
VLAAVTSDVALRRCILALAVALACVVAVVLAHAYPSSEAVRLRNALLVREQPIANFNWEPAAAPAGFFQESVAPPVLFITVAARLREQAGSDDFAHARALASHLVEHAGDRGPIRSLDAEETYRAIIEDGRGYCADFVDTFIALALAADIPVRAWAFSFDGFGGSGHVVAEIYDRGRGQWQMLDVYNNVHPVDQATGRVLSALELRDALLGRAGPARFVRLGPGRLGFPVEEKLMAYYRLGLPQWYLWMGNNVISRNQAPGVRAVAAVAEPFGELGAILQGAYPGIAIYPVEENSVQRQHMLTLRRLLLAGSAIGLTLGAGLVALLVVLAQRALLRQWPRFVQPRNR